MRACVLVIVCLYVSPAPIPFFLSSDYVFVYVLLSVCFLWGPFLYPFLHLSFCLFSMSGIVGNLSVI